MIYEDKILLNRFDRIKFKKIRQIKNISVKKLAEGIQQERSVVYYLENGTIKKPSFDLVSNACYFMEIDIRDVRKENGNL
jgi:transcriptional regulator with XRE-family HTH domain